MAIDPICKMTVDEKTAKFTSEFKGKKYYFCAPGCKKKFDSDPAKYVGEDRAVLSARSRNLHKSRLFLHIFR